MPLVIYAADGSIKATFAPTTIDLTTQVSGILPLLNGGSGADLSATGGANQFVKQSSSGAALSVGTIASADIATALTTPGPIGGSTPNDITALKLFLPTPTELTESGDAITVTQSYHTIAAQTGTTDNLVTINGGTANQLLFLQAKPGHQITIKSTGNVHLNGGSTFAMSGAAGVLFACDGTNWTDVPAAPTMVGATFSAAGSAGAVVAPIAGDNTKAFTGNNKWSVLPLTLFSQSDDVTVASTNAETTLIGSGIGSVTIPANNINVAGRAFEIRAVGYASRASGNTTIKISVGGTVIFTFGPSATAWGTNNRFEIYAKFTTKTTGATGTIKGQGYVDTFTAVNAFVRNALVATAATTLDLTGTLAVDVTWTWSVSGAGQTVTCTNLDIIQIAG